MRAGCVGWMALMLSWSDALASRFQAAPKESHVLAVKRIFRYLKGIEEFELWYPKGKDLSLIAYTDADWAGCIDD